MKNKEFKEMTTLELNAKYIDLKSQLYTLRFSQATNQLENNSEIGTCKKNIARVLTEIRARELAEVGGKYVRK